MQATYNWKLNHWNSYALKCERFSSPHPISRPLPECDWIHSKTHNFESHDFHLKSVHFYIYLWIPNECRSEICPHMLIAEFFDTQQRKSAQIHCPIYIAMLNCYNQMNLIPCVPIFWKEKSWITHILIGVQMRLNCFHLFSFLSQNLIIIDLNIRFKLPVKLHCELMHSLELWKFLVYHGNTIKRCHRW